MKRRRVPQTSGGNEGKEISKQRQRAVWNTKKTKPGTNKIKVQNELMTRTEEILKPFARKRDKIGKNTLVESMMGNMLAHDDYDPIRKGFFDYLRRRGSYLRGR